MAPNRRTSWGARSSNVATLASSAQPVLKALMSIGEGFNIPAIKGVAGLMLLVVERYYRQDYHNLLQRVYQLAVTLVTHLQDSTISDTQRQNVAATYKEFEEIVLLLNKMANKKWRFLQWIARQEEAADLLQICQLKVSRAIELFNLRAQLEMREEFEAHRSNNAQRQVDILQAIGDQHDEILAALSPSGSQTPKSASQIHANPEHLPSSPAFFFGRDEELRSLLEILTRDSPTCVAILGPGGIGKTSLLLKALHDSRVTGLYEARRFFVRCDSAKSRDGLLAVVAKNLGVEGEHLLDQVSRFFKELPRAVLCLDNLESAWEPENCRSAVENLLQSLVALPSLTLVVTLRGAVRPVGVLWSQPLIPPLGTLAPEAARESFFAYAGIRQNPTVVAQVDDLLKSADYLPLAISLLGTVAQWEPVSSVVRRWESESTSFHQRTVDRTGSLDVSIQFSLNSPRLMAAPEAREVLSILSLLPDGLKDENVETIFPLYKKLSRGLTVLRQTSLAYDEGDEALKTTRVLAPVRAYVLANHPPHPHLRGRLDSYYAELALLIANINKSEGRKIIKLLLPEIGNLHSVISSALRGYCKTGGKSRLDAEDGPSLAILVDAAIRLSRFQRTISFGSTDTLTAALEAAKACGEKGLEGLVTLHLGRLHLTLFGPKPSTHALCDGALNILREVGDNATLADCLFLKMQLTPRNDLQRAHDYLAESLRIAVPSGNRYCQAKCLVKMAELEHTKGRIQEAMSRAKEALTIFYDLDDCVNIGLTTYLMGLVSQQVSAYGTAFGYYARSLEFLDKAGEELFMAKTLTSIGDVHCILCDYEASLAALERSMAILRKFNRTTHSMAGYALVNIAIAQAARYDHEKALDFLQRAIRTFDDIKTPAESHARIICAIVHGDLAYNRGAYDEADLHYNRALRYSRKTQSAEEEAQIHLKLGRTALSNESPALSKTYALTAFSIFRKIGASHGQATCIQFLGDVCIGEGDRIAAKELYLTAKSILTELDIRRGVADCNLGLARIASEEGNINEALPLAHSARLLYAGTSDTQGVTRCQELFGKL